jgi:transcriptional regulator with XRE-family HTH domain
MKIAQDNSDSTIINELGNRLARYRLNRNQTQAVLAKESGVSLRTIVRIEHGKSVQLTSIIRVLRALHLLGNLEALVPQPPVSPVQQVKMHGKRRQRASSPSDEPDQKQPWFWEDEP